MVSAPRAMTCRVVVAAALTIAGVQGSLSGGFGAGRLRKFRGHQFSPGDSVTSDDPIEQLYFAGAVLDNFAPVGKQKPWSGPGQRYWVNAKFRSNKSKHHHPSGPPPVFFFIGGEGPESAKHVSDQMFMYELARRHGAVMVGLEHRFYGESYPTEDMSTNNLQYLSSAQALADAARFISNFTAEQGLASSRVITFGGSYPGSLSAWMRLKYPHLIAGAVASSAPLLAQLDFPEYMDVVADSLRYFGGQACVDRMAAAVVALAGMLTSGNTSQLEQDFRACGPMTEAKDQWVFASNVMGDIQDTVQYNLEKHDRINVTDVCNALDPSKGAADPYHALASLVPTYLKQANESCLEVSWNDSLAEMTKAAFDGNSSSRQWTYQTCNEFGYYQTAGSPSQPFSPLKGLIDLDSFLDICRLAFNITTMPPVDWMNHYYGALGIAGSRIAFPSGSLDPWSVLAVKADTRMSDATELSVYIPNAAHCADMRANHPDDLPVMRRARRAIASQVDHWLHAPPDGPHAHGSSVGVGAAVGIGLGGFLIGTLGSMLVALVLVRRKERESTERYELSGSVRHPLLGRDSFDSFGG